MTIEQSLAGIDLAHGGRALAAPGQPLSAAAQRLLGAGIPANTRRAYASDRSDWAAFARTAGSAPLPADASLLVEYVSTLLTVGSPTVDSPRPLTVATVERRLAAVSTWSTEQGHGRPDLRAARLAIRGYRRESGRQVRQAAPVTVATLRALVAQAGAQRDPDSLRCRRDRAIVLLGFALGARRSELVALDLVDLRREPAEGMTVLVQRAKTADSHSAVRVRWAADSALCPVRATQAYVSGLRDRGATDGPLFRRITRSDALLAHRLRPEAVADVIARLADEAGIEAPEGYAGFSGHSLRRGFATEARRAGADALKIARAGGWADGSTSLARYLADVDGWADHPLDGVL